MKKKSFLLVLMFISMFFLGSNGVKASGLTCIYDDGLNTPYTMLVQDDNGKFNVYLNYYGDPTPSDENWYNPLSTEGNSVDFDWTQLYNFRFENEKLTGCPNYTRYKHSNGKYTFYFNDEKTWHLDYDLLKEYNEAINPETKETFDDDYTDIINNTEWLAICEYKDVELYFNKETFILKNKSSMIDTTRAGFTHTELMDYYSYQKYCPTSIYQKFNTALSMSGLYDATYYLTARDDVNNANRQAVINATINDSTGNKEPQDPVEGCDIFGDDVLEIINDVLGIVRIAVPILLIVLLIIDFCQAIFSESSDAMSKVTKKSIKRIIIAVVIFFVPTFVNLILNVANDVWEDINSETCGITGGQSQTSNSGIKDVDWWEKYYG